MIEIQKGEKNLGKIHGYSAASGMAKLFLSIIAVLQAVKKVAKSDYL